MIEAEDDHYNPTVRLLEIDRQNTSCGFHLTRSRWDPYPWISGVDSNSPADVAGMKAGDCVLEVNGEDVVGLRISEVAELIRRKYQVTLLLWNAGVDPKCSPEDLCCGPMPLNMQRLSACTNAIIGSLECPVCLNTISPPACQCVNGHLICIRCHAKSEKCPVCRVRLSRGRCLFADQVYNSLIDAFGLSKEPSDKEKINKIHQIFKQRNKKKAVPDIKITQSYANRFLSRLVAKSSSAENLTNHNIIPRTFLAVQNEFQSNLKTKSLSACDIFTQNSNTRFGSRSNLAFKNSSSCHGSFDSINSNSKKEDGHLYHCPFSDECNEKYLAKNVLQHFQDKHDGPLIQYFKNKIQFKLLDQHENTYCFVYKDKMLFLKIHSSNSAETRNGVFIWMWLLGEQQSANTSKLHINLYFSANPEKILFSLTSSLFSLADYSYQNILENQLGTFISLETINALNAGANRKEHINLEIEVKHSEKK